MLYKQAILLILLSFFFLFQSDEISFQVFKMRGIAREREQTDRQTDRDRQRQRQKHRQTDRDRERQRQRNREGISNKYKVYVTDGTHTQKERTPIQMEHTHTKKGHQYRWNTHTKRKDTNTDGTHTHTQRKDTNTDGTHTQKERTPKQKQRPRDFLKGFQQTEVNYGSLMGRPNTL